MNISINQGVIFCGGFGTRIKKYTKGLPKPLVKIKNKSFIIYLIENLIRFGVNEIYLLCHYKTEIFRKEFKDIKIKNCKIYIIHEKEPLGSAGSLLNIRKKLKNYFFIFNGDTFFDFNYLDLKKNLNKNDIATLAILENHKITKSNLCIKKNRITNFVKGKKKIINSGIGIINKKIFKYLDKFKNKFISLEKDIYPILCFQKKISGKVYSIKNHGFIDIGTPQDFKKIKTFFKKTLLKKAIILDRDGVINKDIGYAFNSNQIKWGKNLFKFLKKLNDDGFLVFIVTNQSGIGRGFYKYKDVVNLHNWMNKIFMLNNAHIDDFFFSPYYKDSKLAEYRKKKYFILRKPNTEVIKLIQKKWKIDIKNSIMVGDNLSDEKFAKNVGLKFLFCSYGKNLIDIYRLINNNKFQLNKLK